jgi:Fe-S cluster assembly ATP-binding protein
MLEFKNVSFEVIQEGKVRKILDQINMKLSDDKFAVITGPNGGGKSTLAKLIAGIEHPTSGEIYFNGKNITKWTITERAKAGISFAFQNPVRFKGINVRDLIQLATGSMETSDNKLCTHLAEVGLCAKDYINRDMDGSLSGGELKRIEIATILAKKNTLLAVFDEPEAGIDLWSFHKLIGVFEKMHKRNNLGILIISHQERILNIADEVILISNGKIKKQGTRQEVLPELLDIVDNCKFFQSEDGIK